MYFRWAAALCSLCIIGLGFAGHGYGQVIQTRPLADDAAIRFRSYRQIENALKAAPTPEDWDTAVFVSSKAVNRLAALLPGTVVPLGPSASPTLRVTVEDAALIWRLGAVEAKIDLMVNYAQAGTELDLSADALFVVSAVERDPEHADSILLLLEPHILSLKPRLSALGLASPADSRLADLMALGLTAALNEKLRIAVPLKSSFSYSTKIDDTTKLPVGNGTNITFQISSVGESLKTTLIYRPIVTADGVWALATVAENGQEAASNEVDEPVTGDQRAQLDGMESALLAKLAPYVARPSDFAIHVSSRLLGKVVQKYNVLAPAQRIVRAGSTAVTGNLYEQRWRDDVLGDGGVFISLTNPNAAVGTLNTGPLSGSWNAPTSTATLTVPARAEANADIHIHVDPLIGGGAGTSTKLLGNASEVLQATATLRTLSVNGQAGLFIVPDLPCQAIRVSARTNGELKIGPLLTNVPQIGANVSFAVGKEQLKPFLVLDSLPRVYPIGATIERQDHIDGLQVTLSEFDVMSSESGAWVAANFAASPVLVSQLPPPSVAASDLVNSVQAKLSTVRAVCNLDPDLELVVGDIAIGQNNEFVKFFKAVAKGVEDVAKTAGKAGQDVAAALAKATNDAANTTVKAVDDVGDTAGKALNDAGNAAGKAATDAANTANKAVNDTGNTVAKAANDTGNTVGKAMNDAGNTAGKAVNDVGNTAGKALNDVGKALGNGFHF